MSYTLDMLSTKADCTALITMAETEKRTLNFRKEAEILQTQNATQTTQGIIEDLASVNQELDSIVPFFGTLTPGSKLYAETEAKIKRLEFKKYLLDKRQVNYGPIKLVDRQYDLECIEQNIAATDTYIAALMARRDELPA